MNWRIEMVKLEVGWLRQKLKMQKAGSKLLWWKNTIKFRMDLRKEYDRLNVSCFGGLMKRPPLFWNEEVVVSRRQEVVINGKDFDQRGYVLGCYSYSNVDAYIWISSQLHYSKQEAIDTLIHEMSHQFIKEVMGKDEEHGSLFASTLKTAMVRSGFLEIMK